MRLKTLLLLAAFLAGTKTWAIDLPQAAVLQDDDEDDRDEDREEDEDDDNDDKKDKPRRPKKPKRPKKPQPRPEEPVPNPDPPPAPAPPEPAPAPQPPPAQGPDLSAARFFPNPWQANKHNGLNITIDRLADPSRVTIYTVAGRLVKKIQAASGAAQWDLTDETGEPVASGIYFYLIEADNRRHKGTLAVIR